MENTPMEHDPKYPVVLLKQQIHVIVKYDQNLVLHNGMRETLNQTRKKFWIAKPINYIRRM